MDLFGKADLQKKKLFRDRLVLFSLSLKEKKKLFVCNHLIFNYRVLILELNGVTEYKYVMASS